MLSQRQTEQIERLQKFFIHVMQNKIKGNFIVMCKGNGEIGDQIKYEGFYDLSIPKSISEEELGRILLTK